MDESPKGAHNALIAAKAACRIDKLDEAVSWPEIAFEWEGATMFKTVKRESKLGPIRTTADSC